MGRSPCPCSTPRGTSRFHSLQGKARGRRFGTLLGRGNLSKRGKAASKNDSLRHPGLPTGLKRQLSHSLLDYRIHRHSPIFVRVVHHQVDEQRQQVTQDRRAIAHLCAIGSAVPRRASMQKLVSQHVEPVEQDRQDDWRVAFRKGGIRRALCRFKG